jgi:tyrosinase
MTYDTAPRMRRDVQSLLADGDEGRRVLDDYARAIALMRERDAGPDDPADPLSWRFQAAIHGFPGVRPSLTHPKLWGSCRHNSWFFLPWHRLYLLSFERIVQFHLKDDTWSLPYWDYTKPADESSRLLPEPFRVPQDDNPLFTSERDSQINHPTSPIPVPYERAKATDALAAGVFTRSGDDPAETFAGGIVEDVAPVHSARGSLEGTPHGWVHGVVGGRGGLMSAFETAALDPIFWLHHANIDRLWDVWIKVWGADAMPSSQNWLDSSFEFFAPDGTRDERPIRDILVSEDLGYVYESIDAPEPAPPGLVEVAPEEGIAMPPKLVGVATEVPFAAPTSVDIKLSPPSGDLSLNEAASPETPHRWYLRVEDIVGESPAVPGYDVYVNVPEGERAADHPELRAGGIASFGIPEATRTDAEHGGSGLTDVFDITELVATLFGGESWDPSALKVTVVPVGVSGEAEEGGDVRAGRISVYAG